MKRGDVVLAALSGDYGKPRPAVLVQTDLANETHASVVLCPITSTLRDAPLFRLDLEPCESNGLRKPSQIMVDKLGAVRRERATTIIGHLDDASMVRLNRALAFWLGLG